MSISLEKGQKISLNKSNGEGLTKVIMGLGWDVAQKKSFFGFGGSNESVDLDASCFLFNDQNQPVELVYFGQLQGQNGAIQHSGDNLTGEGSGDDETITVDLTRLPANIKALVFTVSSYRGQTFEQVNNAFCRLMDGSNRQEVARYNLSAQGKHTAQIMAKIYRHNNEWKMHAIGENAQGATPNLIIPQILPHL